MAAELAWLREAAGNLRRLSATVPTWLLEQAAIAGALTADRRTTGRSAALVPRLNAVSLPAERGWEVDADERGLHLRRTVRGVAERYTLDAGALRSAEARWLAERHEALTPRSPSPRP